MKIKRRLLGTLLLIELVLMLLFVYGYYRWTVEWRLNGPTATAQIIDKRDEAGDTYFVSYTYMVGGRPYSREHEVSFAFYNTVGEVQEIVYSPVDATISGIPGTFFNLTFLALVLPILITVNLLVIIGLAVHIRMRLRWN